MPELNNNKAEFLSTFKRVTQDMVAKSEESWDNTYNFRNYRNTTCRDYTEEEVNNIINSGSISEQQRLSRNYFYKDGFYRRILVYYATILKYVGILVPNPSFGKKLSTPHIQKRYFMALDYIDRLNLPEKLTRFSLKALIDGAYYGIIQQVDREKCVLLDLPSEYCRSRFRDFDGNDIIEFNVSYFDSIIEEDARKHALSIYPDVVSKHYKAWKRGSTRTSWVIIPTELGICFSFFDRMTPPFITIIPSTIQYDKAVDTEADKALDEIRKILVQKVPHLTDGTLLFEPDEAAVMHEGAVGMLKGNSNISVLTTYADVDAITSKTSQDAISNYLEEMVQNIYAKTGTSQELFSPKGAQALSMCIANDMSMMMILANKYSRFFSTILDKLFGNANIHFSYNILPVSYYNQSEYITDAMKLAQSGYSFLIPSIALGINQNDLVAIKELENKVLDLDTVLVPLQSSYTMSAKNGEARAAGGQEKSLEEKAPKTIQNEDSLNNQ